MIAAVTGATGYAGQHIVRKLLEEGVRVRAWRHAKSRIPLIFPHVEWIDGDLASSDSMTALVRGADMLVHAALEHVPDRYRGGEGADLAGFIHANVGGSLALLETARHAGVTRAVILSSRAVFGSRPRSGPLTDTDPLAPDTHYGAAKASLEAFVGSWGADGWGIAALRPTGIYGIVEPLERSKWLDLTRLALCGELPAHARSGSEVHAQDVASAAWLLLTADAAKVAGRSFNCSDIVVSTREVMAAVHQAVGTAGPLPPRSEPPAGIMACAGLEQLGLRFGGPALLHDTIAELVRRARHA